MRIIPLKDKFKVESEHRPGVFYFVDLEEKTCSCPEYVFRMQRIKGICKHINAVEEFVSHKGKPGREPTVIDTKAQARREKERKALDKKQKAYDDIVLFVRKQGEVDAIVLLKRFKEEYVNDLVRLGGLVEENGKIRVLE
ncbi:MAG: SWIM zinc finger family protein [Nanoarchaeota archaeon]